MKRNCPVCSSSRNISIFHDYNRREGYTELEGSYMICADCGMRYLTDIASFEEIGGKYEDIYVEPDIDSLKQNIKDTPASQGKKILDIGCNHGVQLHTYHNTGWDVYGIDLNEKAIRDVKTYLPAENFLVTTIEDAPFLDNIFEKIQTFHVLEHVYDPIGFLHKSRNLLKDDGEIEIRIPNGGSLEMKIWGKYASQSWIPFHLNMFDPKTIRKILEERGFRDICISTNPLPWWWILSYRQWTHTINISRGVTNFHMNIGHKLLMALLYIPLWCIARAGYGEELHIFAKK